MRCPWAHKAGGPMTAWLGTALLLLTVYYFKRPRLVYHVEFACYKPEDVWPMFLYIRARTTSAISPSTPGARLARPRRLEHFQPRAAEAPRQPSASATTSSESRTSLRRGLRCGVHLHGNGKSAKVSGLLNKQINLIAVQYFFRYN